MSDEAIETAIRALLASRGTDQSICPSEAARAVAPLGVPDDWRARMPAVRRVAAAMAARGEIVVLQRGRPVDAQAARGPVRLARAMPPAR